MQIINLGILAHVDAGKTTTVEQMLYLSGKLRTLGYVDKGSTQTDFLAVERKRGISVVSALADFEYDSSRVCIIDTPGHMDFTGEVERTLLVLDGVILIVSAAEGIQSQTERFWHVLREMNLPTVIFLNKIDRAGCNPSAVLEMLQTKFSSAIIPLNRCCNAGEANASVESHQLSDESILELCENDNDLAQKYLNDENLSIMDIEAALIRQTTEGRVFPLVYGSALNGVGISALLETVRAFLPFKPLLPDGEPMGIVYKIEHTTAGKFAHIRLYEGTLHNRDTVNVYHSDNETFSSEKITQIQKVSGSKREDVGQLYGNEIAAVCGMTNAKVGDMVGRVFERRNIRISEPLFLFRVYGPGGKERELIQAISELSDEDPLMNYEWEPNQRELIIHVMGKIQIEVLEFLILERYGLTVTFSQPSVIYKETPASRGIGLERYTMPKPCWAVVQLQADPLPRGSGFQYESAVHESVLQHRYQNHVATAVRSAIKQGRLGWEVTDVKFTLTDGESHKFHTHPMDFFLATPIAVMKALADSGSILLEPLVKLRLTADETFVSRIIGDIIGMRGEFDSPTISDGKMTLEAIVPVSASMDYYIKFSSLTSGKGIISSDFHSYKECPLELGATAARRGVDPLDRDKWILHKRGAL